MQIKPFQQRILDFPDDRQGILSDYYEYFDIEDDEEEEDDDEKGEWEEVE